MRKTRGPYTGLLDLPGGRPKDGEPFVATLAREVCEEIGATVEQFGSFHRVRVFVDKSSSGEPISFHHHGVYANVVIGELPQVAPESSDTSGYEWFDLKDGDLDRLSPLARVVLAL